jgi:hypothetical protein
MEEFESRISIISFCEVGLIFRAIGQAQFGVTPPPRTDQNDIYSNQIDSFLNKPTQIRRDWFVIHSFPPSRAGHETCSTPSPNWNLWFQICLKKDPHEKVFRKQDLVLGFIPGGDPRLLFNGMQQQ